MNSSTLPDIQFNNDIDMMDAYESLPVDTRNTKFQARKNHTSMAFAKKSHNLKAMMKIN